jgi:hypothetical protein
MNISVKVKNSIETVLKKIKADTFNENDIKLLLIDIRETIRNESLLRELADFVAHPSRDKGIFNRILNVRYLKIKLLDGQKDKLTEEVQKRIKTETELSAFFLGAINTRKIEKKIFEILLNDGFDDISDSLFREHYPITKKQAKKLIIDNYQLDPDKIYYNLKSEKFFLQVDDVLKFLRGTIQARPVFSQQTFEKEILKALERVINTNNLDKTYIEFVKKRSKTILLCVLCLLHDCKFIFYDGHIGSCYLSIYPKNNDNLSEIPEKDSLIALISDKVGFQMPLFVSNMQIGEFIDTDQNNIEDQQFMRRIPWIKADRSEDNQLVLQELT